MFAIGVDVGLSSETQPSRLASDRTGLGEARAAGPVGRLPIREQ